MERITIIGLGLIGTSLGMALKQAKIRDTEILGHDKDHSVAGKAARRGATDKTEWNLLAAVKGAKMVILAVPVMAMKDILPQIGPHLLPNCVVTDTGSTKTQVIRWAEEYLPKGISFVGGHPMAGKEESGPEAADPGLFTGATYCIIPAKGATSEAVQAVAGLVNLVGAKPFFLDAVEHDSFVAAVSHLPMVLSAALVTTTTTSLNWREMSRLTASGFRDTTRLASGDPEMHRDICLTNRESLVYWINDFIKTLIAYRKLIEEGSPELEKAFIKAWEGRQRWLKGVTEPSSEAVALQDMPSAGERMAGMFLGDRLAQRTRDLLKPEGEKGKKK